LVIKPRKARAIDSGQSRRAGIKKIWTVEEDYGFSDIALIPQ
jgi:hypothetical protein